MKESKNYFEEVAVKWDMMRSGYFTEAMRDAAIELIDLKPDHIVADIGCGTGFMIQGLVKKVFKVYGFDESPQMLEIAKSNLDSFNNVELKLSEGENLPIADDSFDAVFANMYLHHTIDPQKAIRELYRVVHTGGWLLITDMDLHNNEWMKEAMADRWLGFSRDDIKTWFINSGFKNVNITCAKGSCCTVSPDGNDLAIGIFVAYGQK